MSFSIIWNVISLNVNQHKSRVRFLASWCVIKYIRFFAFKFEVIVPNLSLAKNLLIDHKNVNFSNV